MMAKGKLAPEAKVSICQGLGVPISPVLAWLKDAPGSFTICTPKFLSFLQGKEKQGPEDEKVLPCGGS